MYIINNYQIIETQNNHFLSNNHKGIKISSQVLADILQDLQNQPKLEINDEQLGLLAEHYQVPLEKLKSLLMEKLNILKPHFDRKFKKIYLNIEDSMMAKIIENTLLKEYEIEIVDPEFNSYQSESLVIFFRNNYSNQAFENLYPKLHEDVYLITAGVMHNLLIIDNLYYKNSGLPTHFSNLHQVLAYLNSNIPSTKNNWLLYYREILKNQSNQFPDPMINDCQKAYIAYCLHRFASQFTNLWQKATPFDQINWFWQIDLNSFHVHKEVALHSPFSEFDMNLNLSLNKEEELA